MGLFIAQGLEFDATGDQIVRIRTDGLFRYFAEGRAPDEDDRRHLLRDHVRYQPEVLQGIGLQSFRIIDDDRVLLAGVSAGEQCVEQCLHVIWLKRRLRLVQKLADDAAGTDAVALAALDAEHGDGPAEEFIVNGPRHDGFSGTGRTGKNEETFALHHTLNELAKQFVARARDERGRIECLRGG